MNTHILTEEISEPLGGARSARFDIHAGDGNLSIDSLTGGEPVLASGTLQYGEKQGAPSRALVMSNGQANLTLRGSQAGRPWFHFPWSACNGATEWQIHLNPTVLADIAAHSDGGNLHLNLVGMDIRNVSAETGGGNLDVVLPDGTADLSVAARTGAGNVTIEIGAGIRGSHSVEARSGAGNVVVRIPHGVAARIHAATGMGKAIVDGRFSQMDKETYQSPDFDRLADKVEIRAKSGAGNVIVEAR